MALLCRLGFHKWGEWSIWLWKESWGLHHDAFTYRRHCLDCGLYQKKVGKP